MVLLFGRSREALSVISNVVLRHIYERFKHLLNWTMDVKMVLGWKHSDLSAWSWCPKDSLQ
ncbi:hypothetical protein H310_08726 [Aphanomyces invadans]|uniref:Uncharacterized protein n=1 Tax=Aphanomyces invadans TaxID=157072 RepID=A0A024TX55_9STRA|nr:hypothetical protein H310_08726 [Aphanomyces invadans]ETV98608.1 hypothetical protein H310_08726 [Aphanomyces invadans]|eukprot:XP_008872805.1 hypothetical protein H310_08726 [Aphanomyces invadans]